MVLCDKLVSILFHDEDDLLITRQNPSYDGVVSLTGKMF